MIRPDGPANERRRRFDAEVLTHLDAAFRFACWLSRSPGDADDIVQDALLRAYRAFDGLRGDNAKAWLLAIVRNCHATAVRQERRRSWVPLPEDSDAQDGPALVAQGLDPEGASIRDDERRLLLELLARLPEEQRDVLVLRELEDLAYRDIALVTGVPIGTVMSRLARARAALKLHWDAKKQEFAHALR